LKGSRADAKTCALNLLSYRSRSRKELLDRLKRKGFSDGQISDAVKSLERAGLINDEGLAEELFRYSLERKPLGKRGLGALLARRGIDKELIDNTLSARTGEMEEKAALMLVEKKIRTLKNHPEDIVKRRLWGMLRRRGFSSGVIHKVIGLIGK